MVQRSSDRDRRRQLRTIWSDAVDAGARQLRHALAHGTVVGIIALVVTRSFGLPGATLLAFWAAVVSLVPVLGPVVGWMPAVVVAGLSEGWRPALLPWPPSPSSPWSCPAERERQRLLPFASDRFSPSSASPVV
ncbi:MAG: AI-2E family transporter [Acidimicrobiales bacterium]